MKLRKTHRAHLLNLTVQRYVPVMKFTNKQIVLPNFECDRTKIFDFRLKHKTIPFILKSAKGNYEHM